MMKIEGEFQPRSPEAQFEAPEKIPFGDGTIEVFDIQPEAAKSETPVMIAPGWAQTPETFKQNILALAKDGRRALSVNTPTSIEVDDGENYDRQIPEYQYKKIAALLETIDNKGIEQIDGVGHSEGAAHLVLAATLRPEKFRNLVLVNPGGMIGNDNILALIKRFTLHAADKRIRALRGLDPAPRMSETSAKGRKNIFADLKGSLQSAKELAGTKIDKMLEHLKENGIGIAIIHSVDDRLFPMDRMQDTTTRKHIDGFYSVKGGHNQFFTDPERYTKLAQQALDKLEEKSLKQPPR